MAKNEILDEDFAKSSFEIYDKFQTAENAKPLIALLKSNDIQHKVEEPKQIEDPLFIGDTNLFRPKVFVKLRPQDFQRVNQLIETDMLQQIQAGAIDLKQHFLYEFTNEELWDVIRKPDEWNFDTGVIARYLLESRGVEVSTAQVNFMQEERVRKIRRPRKGVDAWVVVLPFIFAGYYWGSLAGGLIAAFSGFALGYYYWQDVSIAPNGEKFYTFDSKSRNSGKTMLIVTFICCFAYMAWFFVMKS